MLTVNIVNDWSCKQKRRRAKITTPASTMALLPQLLLMQIFGKQALNMVIIAETIRNLLIFAVPIYDLHVDERHHKAVCWSRSTMQISLRNKQKWVNLIPLMHKIYCSSQVKSEEVLWGRCLSMPVVTITVAATSRGRCRFQPQT